MTGVHKSMSLYDLGHAIRMDTLTLLYLYSTSFLFSMFKYKISVISMCKVHAFTSRVDNIVDPDQMASSEAS